MTTVADFGEYTGIMGTVTVGGVPLADVEYDLKWERTTVSHQRSGKRSAINIPGSLKVSTTIKKALVRTDAPTVIGSTLTDVPATGTAGNIKTGVTLTADGRTASTSPTIATPSRVRATVVTANITTEGTLTIIGEDANGVVITDPIPVGLLTVGQYVTSSKVFKKVYGVDVDGIRSTTGTLTIASLAGNASYTVGDPKIFYLVGTLTKGVHTLVFTQPDCWFANGGINWTNGDEIVEVNLNVEMHDPDLLTVAET